MCRCSTSIWETFGSLKPCEDWDSRNNTLVDVSVPCAEVNFAIAMYFYSHVFSRHSVIFCSFYIPKKCVWCPYDLGRVPCHVKRRAEIMRQPWIIPPLTEENIHRVFLTRENPKLHLIEKKRQVSFLLCWLFPHHASLFNFSNGNDLELHVNHNRRTYKRIMENLPVIHQPILNQSLRCAL